MVVSGYVTVSFGDYATKKHEYATIGSMLHSQLRCSHSRKPDLLTLVQADDKDGELTVNYHGASRVVELCKNCPDSLDWNWQDDAACKNTYPEVDMFDFSPLNPASVLIEKFCGNCPVVLECLDFALTAGPDAVGGIWGGVAIRDYMKPREIELALTKKRKELTQGDDTE